MKTLNANIEVLEQSVSDSETRATIVSDKCKQLSARESEAERDLEYAQEMMTRQEARLQNAKEVVRHNAKRAQKLVDGVDDWRILQLSLWVRDYGEAAQNALQALAETCCAPPYKVRFACLVATTDLQRHLTKHQRRLQIFLHRLTSETVSTREKQSFMEIDESVFSTSSDSMKSGVSVASGYTKRLAGFRRSLAPKVQETALIDDIPEIARRSTISLRVVTLDMTKSQLTKSRVSGLPSATTTRK